jgi:D-inositol-3-phosphate glycosyltransferase
MQKLNFALLSIHSCPLGKPGGKDTGGMNVHVRELALQLGKQGHQVDVFTRLHDVGEPEIVALGENARLVHLRSGKEDADKQTLYDYLPEIAANLEGFRRREGIRYSVIYSHYWLSGWTGRLVNNKWHIPHLTMFHTLGAVKNSLGIGENEPPLRIASEKQLMRECDRIIASTGREKETLHGSYGVPLEKVAVIPCGVNLDLFIPADCTKARRQLGIKSGKIILFAGRIDRIKGLDRLIEAVAMLDHISDLKLLVIGGDENSREEIARLKNMAQELGVGGIVDFRESVPQEFLPTYYSAADVFVLPSYYESFGMAALEALACGTPVVTTPMGDWENIIQPGVNGYIAPDNSPPHLARTLSLALTESSFAPPALIHSTVARFGWENIAKQTLKVCTELLSKESEKVHEKR